MVKEHWDEITSNITTDPRLADVMVEQAIDAVRNRRKVP
jgi:hypothetical protein